MFCCLGLWRLDIAFLDNSIVPLFLRKLVLGIPAQASGKNYAAANASGGPSCPALLVSYPARGS
jgi:hypothetical protein